MAGLLLDAVAGVFKDSIRGIKITKRLLARHDFLRKSQEYEKNFSFVKYVHVPREHAGITRADALVNDTLDNPK